jgi:choline dehydrogenase
MILFEGKRATGVQYVSRLSGISGTVEASKEVILAAGAVHSPQILQLSGIGDGELLKSFDIKTKVDLPGVGKNFQDHPTLYPVWNCEADFLLFPKNLQTVENHYSNMMCFF